MIKTFIFISLIFFSFEIDHCFEAYNICKKCISGYKLYNSNYGSYCMKEEDSYINETAHCLDFHNNQCQQCEKGYAFTMDGECRENPNHCSLFQGETCIECEHYYILKEGVCEKSTCYSFDEGVCKCDEGFYNNDKGGCSKIPIDFCYEGNATFCWECDDGYYSNDKGECIKIPFEFCEYGNATYCEECEYKYYTNKDGGCSKIPIKYCEYGNDTYCEQCHYKYEFNETTKECTLREGYEEEEEQTSGGGNIKNCEKVNNKDNTICDSCEDNYDWDSKTKSCVFLCEGETEQYCDECNLNYNSYDYGKTCEKIDPDYVEKGFSKYAKFDFAVLCILLFLVL